MTTSTQDAPRFALGQRVRVIANQGGLYAAQIGVVGVISKQRQKRRYGYRNYDVSYLNERDQERIVIVREDDLEPVTEIVEKPPTPQKSARFSAGQQVRVIGVDDVHLVGAVGSIVRERPPRRWDQRTYDFAYTDNDGHEVIVYGVREDGLEAVSEATPDDEPTDEATPPPVQPTDALFRVGQRVTVHPPADGLEDEYPSFTAYPVVGEIASACLVTADGVRCYDVRFPRIERGVSSDWWPPVSIREAHLVPEPSQAGWMAHEAAMARTKKAPAQPQPKFSVGEHVYVDPRSELAYARYTRKGAIGVIVGVGKPVRGIRRYDVRYAGSREAKLAAQRDPLHALPVTQVREEHLVSDEGRLRHAYEVRAEKQLRDDEKLWCDKGGCFEDDCVVCQQTPEWRERHGLPLSKPPAPAPKKPAKTSEPATPPAAPDARTTVVITSARGRSVSCEHDWQTWGADSRFRLRRKCKRAERIEVAAAPVASEVSA